tara:strand:+ start:1148 stop:1441 length:294 start_codon:yes stop_codon:yes gene_type:complete
MIGIELYCYDVGEWVRIQRKGIHFDRLAAITERKHLSNPVPTNIYTVSLIEAPSIELMVPEDDLRKAAVQPDKEVSCVCGGDSLQVPHHYSWCPKGK